MCRCAFWYFPSDLINRKWSNWPKCPKMSCFYEQACTCHISQTEWHTHLNLKASERYGSLNVPFGIFSPIRSTGSYRSGHNVQGLRFSKTSLYGSYLRNGEAYSIDFGLKWKISVSRCAYWYFRSDLINRNGQNGQNITKLSGNQVSMGHILSKISLYWSYLRNREAYSFDFGCKWKILVSRFAYLYFWSALMNRKRSKWPKCHNN